MMKTTIRLFPVCEKAVEERTLRGFSASPGIVKGRARVITCHEDLSGIKAGTILVCPNFSPELSFIFPHGKAIVTDRGSALANAAIIAREYGVPAVVGTSFATENIEDDDFIVVDGSRGPVEIISCDPY